MSLLRYALLLIALLSTGQSASVLAATRSHGMVTDAERALRGTWYSAAGSITFKDNGTIEYKGRYYFYAVSNGGFIQLSGAHNMIALSYQLAGGKLTLTANGKTTVYSRKQRAGK